MYYRCVIDRVRVCIGIEQWNWCCGIGNSISIYWSVDLVELDSMRWNNEVLCAFMFIQL